MGVLQGLPRSPLPGLPPTYWTGKGWGLTAPSIPLLHMGAPTSSPEAAREQGWGTWAHKGWPPPQQDPSVHFTGASWHQTEAHLRPPPDSLLPGPGLLPPSPLTASLKLGAQALFWGSLAKRQLSPAPPASWPSSTFRETEGTGRRSV